jgi:uncharacterized membrane protein
VERRWLFSIAGVVWSAVGLLLLGYAIVWLAPVDVRTEVVLALTGAGLALLAARYLFARIVRSNIARIERGPARASAFSFQAWRSYVVTVFMIALGITLRHSAIPRPALAVVYEAIGGALLITSLLYHRRFFASGDGTAV